MCFFRKGDAPSERGMTLWIVTGWGKPQPFRLGHIHTRMDATEPFKVVFTSFRMTRLLFRMTT